MVATGGSFVKIVGFLLLILAKLCWLTRESSGMVTGFGKLSTNNHPQKFKKPSNIHKNAKIL